MQKRVMVRFLYTLSLLIENYLPLKILSMIMKYHNHKLQTNPWYREEEPHNNHETPGRQTTQSNQLSLPHRVDCNEKFQVDTSYTNTCCVMLWTKFKLEKRPITHKLCKREVWFLYTALLLIEIYRPVPVKFQK